MDEQTPTAQPYAFGELLRRLRRSARLTQEALAERAGVSARAIADLERGINKAPRRDTLRLLADALRLPATERGALIEAARRGRPGTFGAARTHPERAAATAGGADAGRLTGGTSSPMTNLPAQLTSFIGRERERDEVAAQLREARMVTLTGTGGSGKTRLALAVAEALLGVHAGGVWLAELAPLSDAASGGGPLVARTVAQVLGVREEPGRPLVQSLIDHLKDRHLLLVLDNCEHLIHACAELASALLRGCPTLRILATSREELRASGERRWRVPSLTVPDPRRLPPPELAGSYEAVRLFVERARDRRPDFTLTASNARPVAQICARLDGIPLAIELAAARVGGLPVEAIADRLDDRFRLLTGGARDALPRQRTLRATLDWSYDLLAEDEQRLLGRLSVFAGGCTLEAAEAVCAGPGLESLKVADLLGNLENKSLVQLEEAGPEAERSRYRLLETVRQYAAERLVERGEAAAVRDRHLGWCAALAGEAEQHLRGPGQAHWLERLETEHDNLRAALGWANEHGRSDQGLRLAGTLWRFWWARGHLGEGRGWLEAALTGGTGSATVRAKALSGAGNLAWQQGTMGGRPRCTRRP